MATASTISRAEPYDNHNHNIKTSQPVRLRGRSTTGIEFEEYLPASHPCQYACTGTSAEGDRDQQPPDSSDLKPNDSRGGPPVAWKYRYQVSSPISRLCPRSTVAGLKTGIWESKELYPSASVPRRYKQRNSYNHGRSRDGSSRTGRSLDGGVIGHGDNRGARAVDHGRLQHDGDAASDAVMMVHKLRLQSESALHMYLLRSCF